jgi:hypothetical protein
MNANRRPGSKKKVNSLPARKLRAKQVRDVKGGIIVVCRSVVTEKVGPDHFAALEPPPDPDFSGKR